MGCVWEPLLGRGSCTSHGPCLAQALEQVGENQVDTELVPVLEGPPEVLGFHIFKYYIDRLVRLRVRLTCAATKPENSQVREKGGG
jgi:hypothetical protein